MSGLWRLALHSHSARHGENLIIICALILAIGISSLCASLTVRITDVLYQQGSARLGGDMQISTSRPLPAELTTRPAQKNGRQSTQLYFPSMVMDATQQQFLLASVKAVDADYPLIASLDLETQQGMIKQSHGPAAGEVWVDKNVLQRLNLQLGDSLHLGDRRLPITAIILKEPDSFTFFSALSARVLINQHDLDSLNVLSQGSRVTYQYTYTGDKAELDAWATELRPKLPDYAKLKQVDEEDNDRLDTIATQIRQFLSLINIVSLLFAAAAISMALQRYQQRQQTQIGIMRCYGISQKRLLILSAMQLGVLLSIASLIATLGALWMDSALASYIQHSFDITLAARHASPFIQGIGIGGALLFGFALLPLRALIQRPVLQILKGAPVSIKPSTSQIILYGLLGLGLFFSLFGLAWQSLLLLSILILVLGICYLLLPYLLALLQKSSRYFLWQASLARLRFYKNASFVQFSALVCVLFAMLTLSLVSTELLSSWQRYQTQQMPNHFAINIQPDEIDDFRQALVAAQVAPQTLYPMVRGRLSAINHTEIRTLFPQEEKRPRATQRELNLTWATQMPADNILLEGHWWTDDHSTQGGVSIEQSLAEQLKVKLGDTLTFDMMGETLDAPILSIRRVDWQSFSPNFYIIFSEGLINQFAHQYITSFYLPDESGAISRQLVQQFPALSLFDIGFIITQIQTLIDQLSRLIQLLLAFILLSGLCVVSAAIYSALPKRQQESAILRALGARQTQLYQYLLFEMAALGFLIGLCAIALAELTCFMLHNRWFKLDFNWHIELYLLIPLSSALVIALLGWVMNRHLRWNSMSRLKSYS